MFIIEVFIIEVFIIEVFIIEVFIIEVFIIEVFIIEVFIIEVFIIEVFIIEVFIIEVFIIEVFIDNCKHRFICVYRPPSYDLLHTNMATRCLHMLSDIDYAFTICSDFIMPNFNWSENIDFTTLCPLYVC